METILYTKALTGINAGENEVLDLFDDIINQASMALKNRSSYAKFAHYIPRALDFLNDLTIPQHIPHTGYEWTTEDMDDPSVDVTIRLIKRAVSYKDVYELKIDAYPLFFRAFFYTYHDGEYQYKIMTRAFIKTEKNPPIQQEAITETALKALAFYKNPKKKLILLKNENK